MDAIFEDLWVVLCGKKILGKKMYERFLALEGVL